MKVFVRYSKGKGLHKINPGLLCEYNLDTFDWQKSRRIVVKRVVSMGHLSDWYGAFIYGGICGFRKIAKEEAVDVSPWNLNFYVQGLEY